MRLRAQQRTPTPAPTDGQAGRTRGARASTVAATEAATTATQPATAGHKRLCWREDLQATLEVDTRQGLPQTTDVSTQRASTRPLERAMAAQQRRCNKNHSKRKLRAISKQIARMEDEVYQAMAVMDARTGKMLNYRQLR